MAQHDGALAGMILIITGAAVIIFRKPFVNVIVDFQIQAFRMPFGKKTYDIGYLFVPAMGLVFIVAGILSIFGILK